MKFKNILNKAKNTYIKKSEGFDNFLDNENSIYSLNSILKNQNNPIGIFNGIEINKQNFNNYSNQNSLKENNLENFQERENNNNNNSGSQVINGGTHNIPNLNIIGGENNPNVPINIIAKNYINPDSFNDSESEEKIETKSVSLAKIPDKLLKESATDWEPINYRGVDESYKLYELSKVEIKFDESTQKLIYKISEPELTEEELEILEELKKGFIYVFEKFSPEFINISEGELISKGTKKLCSKYKIKLSEEQFEKITYYLKRDFLGLEVIEPIFHDPYVEDISCDGLNVPLFVNHLKYGALEINRTFSNLIKLNSFIVKLAQKSNEEISLSKPILQGALPDGSRVEAIYGKEISEKGSSFTIRKFRAEPFTPIHLIEFGSMPTLLLAYLWLAIENKQSIIVSGGTATGKTTILNALSLFVPPTAKIVSIEDTPELNLPHQHWLPMIARENEGKAEVSMFDLLKASLRERPDYIIVGEIRGKEAAILFQGMATGHAGLGTVHAEKFNDLVNRMSIDPINLPKQLLTEIDLVIFLKSVKIKENIVRRTGSVIEVIDYNSKQDHFTINEFMKFNIAEDSFTFKEKSAVISHLITLRGGKEESLWQEIEKRRRILDLMHKKKILEFKMVSNVIKAYYKNPSEIFNYIEQYETKIKDK